MWSDRPNAEFQLLAQGYTSRPSRRTHGILCVSYVPFYLLHARSKVGPEVLDVLVSPLGGRAETALSRSPSSSWLISVSAMGQTHGSHSTACHSDECFLHTVHMRQRVTKMNVFIQSPDQGGEGESKQEKGPGSRTKTMLFWSRPGR